MSGLRECPFCGGEAQLHSWEDDDVYTVVCDHCDASGRHYSGASEAIAAWNRRAPSAEARAAAEEMRERAAAHVDCGCSGRADALAATNKGERFVACGNDPCGAIEARAIRALPLPLPGEEG